MGTLINEPGFYPQITCDEYFAEPCPVPALTSSGIKTLLTKSPAHFAYGHPALNPNRPETNATTAMHKGNVAHRLALGKGKDYAVLPFDAYQSKEAKAAKADAEAAGLIPIKEKDMPSIEAMATVLKAGFQSILGASDYETEVVMAWREGGVWCRGMIDVWCPSRGIAIDLKTTADASLPVIKRQMVSIGHDIQSAWYSRGLSALAPQMAGRIKFIDLFVETAAPHGSQAVVLDEMSRMSAEAEIDRALRLFERCLKDGQWPGYARQVQTISIADWAIRERINREADYQMENDDA